MPKYENHVPDKTIVLTRVSDGRRMVLSLITIYPHIPCGAGVVGGLEEIPNQWDGMKDSELSSLAAHYQYIGILQLYVCYR